MFRFNMSTQGPITRSNLARSSLTQRNKPRALTVAALGLFNSSAISPIMKQQNVLTTGSNLTTRYKQEFILKESVQLPIYPVQSH